MKPFVLILCGGVGTRLWPLSRETYPKQFLPLVGGESFFDLTYRRARQLTDDDRIFFLTTESLASLVKAKISRESQIFCEPEARNTGPALSLAFQRIPEENTPCLVLPSDHWIDEEPFLHQIKKVLPFVQDYFVLFGIKPSYAATGFGYIEVKDSQGLPSIHSFREKPPLKDAQVLWKKEGFYWNSGLFLATKKLFFQELFLRNPKIFPPVLSEKESDLLPFFHQIPQCPIDQLLFEKSPQALCFEATFSWSDVGTWQSLAKVYEAYPGLNERQDGVVQMDCRHCLVVNDQKKQKVFLMGVEEQAVIVTDDAIVIVPLKDSEKVKDLQKKALAWSQSSLDWLDGEKLKN